MTFHGAHLRVVRHEPCHLLSISLSVLDLLPPLPLELLLRLSDGFLGAGICRQENFIFLPNEEVVVT